jgi:hypothetical protein
MQYEASEDVFLFSSIAVFPEGTTITKPKLIRIAHDAHNVVRNEKGLDKSQTPAVTGALLVGNEVYLSISTRSKVKTVVYVQAGNPAIKPDVPHQIRMVLDACFNNPEYAAGIHF